MWKILVFLLWIPGLLFAQGPNRFTSTIRPSPVVNAGQDLYLPPGQTSIQAMATSDDPGPGQTYSYGWTGPNGFSSPILRPSLTDLGTYTIQATNSYGCSASDQLLLRAVNPLDTFWTVYPLPSLCFGADSIILDNYVSHPYMNGSSFSGPGVVGRILYPTVAGINNTVNWIVGQKTISDPQTTYPSPNVSVYQDTVVRCPGATATLGAIGVADVYSWSTVTDPQTVLNSTPYYLITINQPVDYLLTAGLTYNDKTCYVKDTVSTMPMSAAFTYQQDTSQGTYGTIYPSEFHFHAVHTAPGYLWNFGDIYVTGGGTSSLRNPPYNYSQWGEYRVILKVLGCASVLSDTMTVTVNHLVVTGVEDNIKDQEIKLYPNPAVDYIYLSFGETIVSHINVFDMSGRMLSNTLINSTNYRMDVSSYRSGTYIVKIFDKKGNSTTAKFMKQ